MTTRSSPTQPNQSVIALTDEVPWAGTPGEPAGGGDGEQADGDPAPGPGPLRAAAGDRPIEDVLRLVTLLEQSPQYARAAGPVLRAAALERPVEDVARLVAELTRPPGPADRADDTIRAAVEHRSVEDVTRLVALLHRAPQRPHCGRTAARAALGARSADDLVELIGRLARDPYRPGGPHPHRREPYPPGEEPMTGPPVPGGHAAATALDERARATTPPDGSAGAAAASGEHTCVGPGGHSGTAGFGGHARASGSDGRAGTDACDDRFGQDGPGGPAGTLEEATPEEAGEPSCGAAGSGGRAARLVFWPGWVAAAALVVCAAAHFPLRHEGAPPLVYGLALAASALCGSLAVALVLRAGVAALVAGSVVPAVLAGLGYVEGRFAPRELSHALSITVAPPTSAGLTAVCASLASLAALSLLLMVHVAERHPEPRGCD
ncbi:hypothetical protein [Streptomyces sp. NPDC018610]|uniref:hypothetical protein n=1 Tax=Streptomyces sp. NPDC018610 TaxID=3365049 RepID=UPI0037A0CE02